MYVYFLHFSTVINIWHLDNNKITKFYICFILLLCLRHVVLHFQFEKISCCYFVSNPLCFMVLYRKEPEMNVQSRTEATHTTLLTQLFLVLLQEISADEALFSSSLWGSSNDGLDQVLESCLLPELSVGDWLVFNHTGANSLGVMGETTPPVHYIICAQDW